MVADRDGADPGADRLHHPGALVPAAERQVPDADVAGGEVVVGVAQAAGHHAHPDLVVAGVVEVDLADLP